jgi:hypothetical protein
LCSVGIALERDEVGNGSADLVARSGADCDVPDDASGIRVQLEDAAQLPCCSGRRFGKEAGLSEVELTGMLAVAAPLLKMDRTEVIEVLSAPSVPERVEDGVAAAMKSSKMVHGGGAGWQKVVVVDWKEQVGANPEEMSWSQR